MSYARILLALGILLPGALLGQFAARHALKFNLSDAIRNGGAAVAYEHRFSKRSGFEVGAGYSGSETPPEGLFEGDRIVHYVLRRTDSVDLNTGLYLNQPAWEYLGQNRAMEPRPNFVPLSDWNFRLGYRFSFQSDTGRFRLFLQPGFQTTRHRYLEISDRLETEFYTRNTAVYGLYPYQTEVTQSTIGHVETRRMRAHHQWISGITYDLGMTLFLHKSIFVEVRATGGMNLSTPYKDNTPLRLRPYYNDFSVHLGYLFGKRYMPRPLITL